jgi:hypothetical protein
MRGMRDWWRSLGFLALVIASVVAVTIGLARIMFGERSTADADAQRPPPTFAVEAAPEDTGGSLTVSGDRQATLTLDRDSYNVSINPDFERGFARVVYGRFGLSGEGGAIWLGGDPLEVEQIDLDGLSIYPDPDECAITRGRLNPEIGVASAGLECRDVSDVRGAATVTIAGTVGLPADMLGMRGDLPPSGGEVRVGSDVLAFDDGRVLVQDALMDDSGRQPLFLFGTDETSSLGFERDPENGDLYLTYLVVDNEQFLVDDKACEVTTTEIGVLSPITTVQEMAISCAELDLGERGVVAIDATLIIDLIIQPAAAARR